MSPKTLIRWYYSVRDDLGAPSLHPVKAEGRVYNKVCGATTKKSRFARGRATGPCPGRLRIWSDKQKEYVCHRCGELWKYRYRYQLRGEVQESVKPAGFEGSISRWTDVGKQLHDFLNDDRYRWESRLFVANVMGSTIRWLVQYGPTEFPEASFSWNRWQVHERVKAGEREWTRRLISAGIDFV